MATVLLNINTKAVEEHAIRLGLIGKSALPVAVRQTLNKAAFNVKTDTMPKTSDTFVHRKPTFFKANSKVVPAQGFDVNTMQATVGFVPKSGDKSHSVDDLAQQESGGNIPNRALIALPVARVGGSWNKNVRTGNRLDNIRKNLVDPNKNSGKGRSKFVRSAIFAGVGGYIFNQQHTRIMQVKKLVRESGGTIVKVSMIESVKKGRQAHVKATNFMKTASEMSAAKMQANFIVLAEAKIGALK